MLIDDNHVLTLRNRYATGWNGERDYDFEDDVNLAPQRSLREMLVDDYPTDAHFTAYAVYAEPGSDDRWLHKNVRHNNGALEFLDENDMLEFLPHITCLVLDIDAAHHPDTPAEDPWHHANRAMQGSTAAEPWMEDVGRAFEFELDASPIVQHSVAFETRGGLKLLWPLAEPRPVWHWESYYTTFLDHLDDCGFPLDPDDACSDWTRLQRVPHPVRQDKEGGRADYKPPTANLPEGAEPPVWSNFYDEEADAFDFGHVRPIDKMFDFSQVDPEQVTVVAQGDFDGPAELPADDDVGSPTKNELKPVKSYDADLFEALYAEQPLAEPGERNPAYFRAAGIVARAFETTDPRRIYKALLPSALKAMLADDGDDFDREEVWGMCKRKARWFDGRQQADEEERERMNEAVAEEMAGDVDPGDVADRLVLLTKKGSSYYVFHEGEGYDAPPNDKSEKAARELEMHSPSLHQEYMRTENGKKSASAMLRDHATMIESVKLSYIEDENRFDPAERELVVGVANLQHGLEPRYHERSALLIDKIGGERAEKLRKWLVSMLYLQYGACMLYLSGPPQSGKTALMNGIAKLWGSNPVDFEDATGDFQSELQRSPFIFADEEVPDDDNGSSSSAILRRMIGTRGRSIEKKFEAPQQLEGNLRVGVAANNLRALPGAEMVGPDDVQALQDRIGHIHVSQDVRPWLNEQAARETNGDLSAYFEPVVEGHGLAEHILYLDEHNDFEPGGRFFIDGWESELTRRLSLDYGDTRQVARAIIDVILSGTRTNAVRFGDGDVKANAMKLQNAWNRICNLRAPRSRDAFENAIDLLADGRDAEVNERPEGASYAIPYTKLDTSKLEIVCGDESIGTVDGLRRQINTPSDDLELEEL